MTVNQIVSLLRGLLKEHDSSKGVYTDQLLWELFTIAKADIYANYRLRRFNYKNPQNYIGFCLELERGLSHECDCITVGCEVLVTKFKLPKYLVGRNTPSLKIYTLGNKEIDIVKENEYFDVYQYSDIHKDKILASIVNNKIVIWGSKSLKVIRVTALWEDVTEIDSVQYCQNDDVSSECIDVYNVDIGLDRDLINMTIQEMFKLINVPLKLTEDLTNDSNAEIKS